MPSNKKNSVMVRIPVELKARLDAMAADLNASYEAGRITRDVELTEQGKKGTWVPLHEVIRIALDEVDDHKARAKRYSAKKRAAKACK